MEETKWLTKGKIIMFSVIILIIGSVIAFIFIRKSNLKKDYIKFESQLEYAAPNYLLKEKISLKENEWREIKIDDLLKQKLVINKRASDCDGYVIAQGLENDDKIEENIIEETNDEKNVAEEINNEEDQIESNEDSSEDKSKDEISENITYNAYITCKKIYKTKGYGTRPTNGNKNEEKTQTQNDTVKPTIELFGDETIKIKQGDKYEELGAIAMDNIDGDITSKIKITGEVDTSKVGTYKLKYTVSDSSKNKTTKERTVIVEEKEIEEENPVEPEKPVEPQVPETPQKPENNTPSPAPSYEKDVTAPIITFNDNSLYQTICAGNSVNIAVNGPYGYVARDNVDGNITSRVSITGDTGVINQPGVYNLYYQVSDSAGNVAHASKQFTVKSCSSTIPDNKPTVSVSSVSCTSMNISVNENRKLLVTINPSNATNKNLSYSSLNTSIATISSDGIVVGISKGSATIVVSSANGRKGTCTVNVR